MSVMKFWSRNKPHLEERFAFGILEYRGQIEVQFGLEIYAANDIRLHIADESVQHRTPEWILKYAIALAEVSRFLMKIFQTDVTINRGETIVGYLNRRLSEAQEPKAPASP